MVAVKRADRSEMKIAVEGCCHGCLDKIYEVLSAVEQREGYKIDLLICCGDFQAVRNNEDLCCMAVPPKYREMATFYKYYSGEVVAPILTLFIGGNHEASNHLWELSYGGWVAPNIYYLGNAGVVRYGGLRIAGLSGIYKPGDYNMARHEQPPYDASTMRSSYHVRSCDVFRMKQLSGNVDIMLSHDWPQGIYHYGDKEQLLRIKPHFGHDISQDCLGSPPAMDLLEKLKPTYWFSAHLHVKFAAVYPHHKGHTKFLALDKCLPRRQFLQILDIPTPDTVTSYRLEYDVEWLAILSLTEPLMKYTKTHWSTPSPLTHQRWQYTPTDEEMDKVRESFGEFTIPENFVATVTPYSEGGRINNRAVVCAQENCQTTELCQRLGITNPFCPVSCHKPQESRNPDEIDLGSSESEAESTTNQAGVAKQVEQTSDEVVPTSGQTEEGVVWSIQKKPGLNLPAPSTAIDSHVTADDDRVSADEEHVTAGEDHVTADEQHVTAIQTNEYEQVLVEEKPSGECAVDSDGGGVAKECSEKQCSSSKPVIKRRNQTMYTLDEEDPAD